MRWRRSMLDVSSSSRRAFLAAGLAAARPDGTHLAESVRWAHVAADPRTAAALGAVLRPSEEQGVRNMDEGEKEVQGGAGSTGNAAMAAAAASTPCLAAAAYTPASAICRWERSEKSVYQSEMGPPHELCNMRFFFESGLH
jgi:hypothetical protein